MISLKPKSIQTFNLRIRNAKFTSSIYLNGIALYDSALEQDKSTFKRFSGFKAETEARFWKCGT